MELGSQARHRAQGDGCREEERTTLRTSVGKARGKQKRQEEDYKDFKVLESQMEAHGSDSNCQSSVMRGSLSHTKWCTTLCSSPFGRLAPHTLLFLHHTLLLPFQHFQGCWNPGLKGHQSIQVFYPQRLSPRQLGTPDLPGGSENPLGLLHLEDRILTTLPYANRNCTIYCVSSTYEAMSWKCDVTQRWQVTSDWYQVLKDP